MTRMRPKIHDLAVAGVAALAITLAGCVTAPPPIQLMDQAQTAVRGARNAGAATTAPDALAEAERRLAAAQQLSAKGDNDKATASAEEAEAAATTARARAEAAQLDEQIQQQASVNQQLQADLQRRQAAAAAAQQAAMAPPAPATSTAAPATAGSVAPAPSATTPTPAPAQGEGPVTLPAIQLGQPTQGSGTPASPTTSGQPGAGVNP